MREKDFDLLQLQRWEAESPAPAVNGNEHLELRKEPTTLSVGPVLEPAALVGKNVLGAIGAAKIDASERAVQTVNQQANTTGGNVSSPR